MAWFSYTGADPSQPADYTLLPGSPSCTGSPESMCALQAMNDGSNNPVITDALKNEIIFALENQTNRPNVQLKPR